LRAERQKEQLRSQELKITVEETIVKYKGHESTID